MIFVLGGRGFLGSAYVRALAERGLPHQVIDRQNYSEFVGASCDLFINANGNSKKYLSKEAPLEDFDRSVRTARQSLVDFRFRRYLLLSSGDVYPDPSSAERTRETEPIDPGRQSPYGFHKLLAEECVRHAARDWLILRLGGFVGPGLRKNAIHDILQGGPLWLDPRSELQYLNSDSAARLALTLLDRGLTREVVNLTGRGTISLEEVIAAAGKGAVPVQPGSPRVRYDVNLEKVSRLVEVPETRAEVLGFVGRERSARPATTPEE